MKIQIPRSRWVDGAKVTEYEVGEVIGLDVYDAFEKAVKAGHDPNKRVVWQYYAI